MRAALRAALVRAMRARGAQPRMTQDERGVNATLGAIGSGVQGLIGAPRYEEGRMQHAQQKRTGAGEE